MAHAHRVWRMRKEYGACAQSMAHAHRVWCMRIEYGACASSMGMRIAYGACAKCQKPGIQKSRNIQYAQSSMRMRDYYSVRMRHTLCACTILCQVRVENQGRNRCRFRKSKSFFGNRNGNRFLEIEIEIVFWKSFFWKSKSKSFFGNRFLEIEIDFGNRNRNRFLEIVFLEIEIEIDFGNRNFGNRNRNWKSFFLEPKSIMPTSVLESCKETSKVSADSFLVS